MKSAILALAAFSAFIGFTSCSSDEITDESNNGGKVKMTFGVQASALTRARTDIKADIPAAIWEEGDKIDIFSVQDPNGNEFTLNQILSPTNYAYFTGECSKANMYYMLYPYQSDATFSMGEVSALDGTKTPCGVITATIPSEQTATANSYDPKAMVQTGAADNQDTQAASMKNTCAFLYITLPEGVDNVVVTTANSTTYYMTGKVEISTTSGMSSIVNRGAFKEGVTSVTLKNVGGKAGTYVMCIAPGESYPGLKVTVNFTNGSTKENTTTKSLQLAGGFFYNLGTVTAPTN